MFGDCSFVLTLEVGFRSDQNGNSYIRRTLKKEKLPQSADPVAKDLKKQRDDTTSFTAPGRHVNSAPPSNEYIGSYNSGEQ